MLSTGDKVSRNTRCGSCSPGTLCFPEIRTKERRDEDKEEFGSCTKRKFGLYVLVKQKDGLGGRDYLG